MKLHEVKKNSKVFVKKVESDIYTRYTTKEDKTYHAEQVTKFEVGDTLGFFLHVQEKPSSCIVTIPLA